MIIFKGFNIKLNGVECWFDYNQNYINYNGFVILFE